MSSALQYSRRILEPGDHWLMNDSNLPPTGGRLLEGASLLLVDDDSGVGLALARMLNLEGAVVVVAGDVEDAIDVLERDKPAELLDVVVTDLEMPVVSGHELIAVLQECRPGLPIVAMTAYNPSVTSPAAVPLFYKPFSPHELVLTLVPLVRQSQERRRQLRQRRADAARVCRSC
jgi:DNA-binding NtrC family response regulator